jgi:hypothetical protein
VLFLDATYLATRPSGPKEGVLVAWGYDEDGHRVLLDVVLGQRELYDDWLEMGRTLTRRGLRPSLLVVTDGAPGLVQSIQELWPDADRQRCTVHRLRNMPKMGSIHTFQGGERDLMVPARRNPRGGRVPARSECVHSSGRPGLPPRPGADGERRRLPGRRGGRWLPVRRPPGRGR